MKTKNQELVIWQLKSTLSSLQQSSLHKEQELSQKLQEQESLWEQQEKMYISRLNFSKQEKQHLEKEFMSKNDGLS